MTFLLDIGNSRVKWGRWDDGRLLDVGSSAHGGKPFKSEAPLWREFAKPDAVYAVSVIGPEGNQSVAQTIRDLWALETRFVGPETGAALVRNGYGDPQQLGADRWAALIGARGRADQPLCVIDAGTAVTIDGLSAEGEFLGGVILPGLGLARRALNAGTHRLGLPGEGDYTVFGRDTESCIRGGTVFGLVGAIERITAEMERAMGVPLVRLLTGGDAGLLAGHLQGDYQQCPDLVLEGLAILAAQTQ